jgi:hypothetical protein
MVRLVEEGHLSWYKSRGLRFNPPDHVFFLLRVIIPTYLIVCRVRTLPERVAMTRTHEVEYCAIVRFTRSFHII